MNEATENDVPVETAFVLMVDLVGFTLLGHESQLRTVASLLECASNCPDISECKAGLRHFMIDRGDGFAFVTFGDPRSPCRAALQLAERWESVSTSRIRMGLHVGPISLRTGADGKSNVTGDAINRAQRVMDAAGPGVILMSQEYSAILLVFDSWRKNIHSFMTKADKHGNVMHLWQLQQSPKRAARAILNYTPIRRIPRTLAVAALLALCVFTIGFTMGRAGSSNSPSQDVPDIESYQSRLAIVERKLDAMNRNKPSSSRYRAE